MSTISPQFCFSFSSTLISPYWNASIVLSRKFDSKHDMICHGRKHHKIIKLSITHIFSYVRRKSMNILLCGVNLPETGSANSSRYWDCDQEIPRSEGGFRFSARHLIRTSVSLDIRFAGKKPDTDLLVPCCRCCRGLHGDIHCQIYQSSWLQCQLLSSAMYSSLHRADWTVTTIVWYNDSEIKSHERKK